MYVTAFWLGCWFFSKAEEDPADCPEDEDDGQEEQDECASSHAFSLLQ